MKKVLLILFILLASVAQASTYKYLIITNTNGGTICLNATNTKLSILWHGSIRIETVGYAFRLQLTDLQSMYFSADGTTALENVLDADAPVQVHSVSGASLGTYASFIDAAGQLNAGTYVISNGKISQTVIIKN